MNKAWFNASKDKRIWNKLFIHYSNRLKSTNPDINKGIGLWESINYDSSYEIAKKGAWTTLNELVLRLTPFKTIPGMISLNIHMYYGVFTFF